jgi:hypothetical protein
MHSRPTRGDSRMQWLYRVVPARPDMPGAPTPEGSALASAHVDYLCHLKEKGVLILAGHTQEHVGTIRGLTVNRRC